MQNKENLEEEKKDEPIGYFKVDEEFIRQLDLILFKYSVVDKNRRLIIGEFLKLIKRGIVKKCGLQL